MAGVARGMGLILGAVMALAAMLAATGASAQQCRADPAPGINWNGCGKRSLMLSGSNFERASLASADLSFTDLRDSNFNGADLTKAKLIRTWLGNAKASQANFSKIEAYRADFQKAQASGANFTAAELERSSFKDAELTGARFAKAELSRVDFGGATITGTDFAYANLARTDFTNAKFKGSLNFASAFFLFTRIEGVDLSAAKGLEQHQLDMACGDDKTRLPGSLTRPKQWPCGDDDSD